MAREATVHKDRSNGALEELICGGIGHGHLPISCGKVAVERGEGNREDQTVDQADGNDWRSHAGSILVELYVKAVQGGLCEHTLVERSGPPCNTAKATVAFRVPTAIVAGPGES